jgi:hypothetical protein
MNNGIVFSFIGMMKSHQNLKTIVIVPVPWPRKSKGVKTYRKALFYSYFSTSTVVRTIWWWHWNYYDGF